MMTWLWNNVVGSIVIGALGAAILFAVWTIGHAAATLIHDHVCRELIRARLASALLSNKEPATAIELKRAAKAWHIFTVFRLLDQWRDLEWVRDEWGEPLPEHPKGCQCQRTYWATYDGEFWLTSTLDAQSQGEQ